MPSRFTAGAYDPELVILMAKALEAAWSGYARPPQNIDLARQIMASAILETIQHDSSKEALTMAAVRALDEAMQSQHLKTALRNAGRLNRNP